MTSVFTEFERLNGTTWLYLSFILMVTVYFRFPRFFSLRNWDLVTLFLFVPGLLATTTGANFFLRPPDEGAISPSTIESVMRVVHQGYLWLFAVTGYFLARSLFDLLLVRRPRIEPNLNLSGLACLAVALFGFMTYEIMVKAPDPSGRASALEAARLLGVSDEESEDETKAAKKPDEPGVSTKDSPSEKPIAPKATSADDSTPPEKDKAEEPDDVAKEVEESNDLAQKVEESNDLAQKVEVPISNGESSHPAVSILMRPVVAGVKSVADQIPSEEAVTRFQLEVAVARGTVLSCHVLVLLALVLIGSQHFNSVSTGMGMATLYLMLPLTAINIEKLDHLLPAVFIVWAVYWFRYPIISGSLFGLAGVFFYPLFLVPLWIGFYGRAGGKRFLIAFLIASAALWIAIWFLDPVRSFLEVWISSVVWKAWYFQPSPNSFWSSSTHWYRLPIFVLFVFMFIALGFWPKEKNLADLIALSTALILALQFWYADRGGTYIHWYLPLLLLMIFRPNLSNILAPTYPPSAKPTT
ncbi:hypothetical protein Pan216_31840 [Planctomycetes bacterium Pan216]|uniref:Uncharacterized protein n=1 Tax=Kolteria novifilia TaxID=2527975 RepID=A0A518B5R5_9BACT|nr:hypothetical protein Pan216_31840 [Planctomycetes bacterium Pan216]